MSWPPALPRRRDRRDGQGVRTRLKKKLSLPREPVGPRVCWCWPCCFFSPPCSRLARAGPRPLDVDWCPHTHITHASTPYAHTHSLTLTHTLIHAHTRGSAASLGRAPRQAKHHGEISPPLGAGVFDAYRRRPSRSMRGGPPTAARPHPRVRGGRSPPSRPCFLAVASSVSSAASKWADGPFLSSGKDFTR